MSEQAEDRLTELLVDQVEKFEGAVDKGVDFAMEQAPELVQQLLLWHGVKSFLFMFVGFLIMGAVVSWCIWLRKKWDSIESEEGQVVTVTITLIAGAILSVAGIVTVAGNLEWLMILIAPKLYLFEYVANLVK